MQRFRFPHALDGERTATVTRVAGEHEFASDDRHRRYQLAPPADTAVGVVHTSPHVDVEWTDDGARATVFVPDSVGFATVRLRTEGSHSALHLPDPSVGAACTAAARGDADATSTLLDAVHTPIALPAFAGSFLGIEDTVALLDTVTDADGTASDEVHAHRFDVVRAAILTPNGLPVSDAADVDALVRGLDAIDAIGDIGLLDALGHLVFGHPDPPRALDTLDALGFDALEDRDDGRFCATELANIVRVGSGGPHAEQRRVARPNGGLDAARRFAADHAGDAPAYDRVKAQASNASYWERGAAWRRALPAAARQSRHELGYVLANALYWTGEVARTDARVDELLLDAAATVARDVGLDWVEGHARYERERAAGHHHRSARNHDRAAAHFRAAEAVARDYDFLDAWDPVYSRTIVESNALSRRSEHSAAVSTLNAGLDAINELDPPAHRRAEIVHHLRGQRRERLAILAGDRDDPQAKREHLEAAKEHYAAADLDRSVDRVERKLAGAPDDDGFGRSARGSGPQPIAPPASDAGPSLDDIPDLHDFLTGTDPGAVGSLDPGAVDPGRASINPYDSRDDEFY